MAPASSRLESILGAVARQRHCRWNSRPCPSCRLWLTHPRTGRRATLFVPWNAQIGSPQLPASVARLHCLRSAGRHGWSHRHVARNACPLPTHACFVLGFAFCCRVLSRVSQVPILSASFWHYLHFLVQSARISFACGGQQHSIFLSNFLYTEGRAHLSHERPPGSAPGRWLTCVVRISHLHTTWLLTGTQRDLGRSINCLTLSVVVALLLWY
jgi:hypothetical protein